jgi:hypothetical protein
VAVGSLDCEAEAAAARGGEAVRAEGRGDGEKMARVEGSGGARRCRGKGEGRGERRGGRVLPGSREDSREKKEREGGGEWFGVEVFIRDNGLLTG